MSTRYSTLDRAILYAIGPRVRDFGDIARAVFWEAAAAVKGTRRSRDDVIGARLQALRKQRRIECVKGRGWRLSAE